MSHVSDMCLSALSERSHVHHFAARQLVMREGTPSDALHIVDSGKVCIVSQGVRLAVLERPAPVGDLGIFAGQDRTATAIAETDCTLIRIATPDLFATLRLHPEAWEGVAMWFVDFARTKVADELARTHTARVQLARLLLSSADPSTGAVSLTQTQIAETLAVRRSTVQRHLDAFRAGGLIARERRIAILDPAGLAREAMI